MPLVVSIESPFHNEDPVLLKRNINYAILCLKDCFINYSEAAYASHLLNTQLVYQGEHFYVGDDVSDEFSCGREAVIEMTHSIRMKADKIVFYTDFGYSNGMISAKNVAEKYNIPIEERTLPQEFMDHVHPR